MPKKKRTKKVHHVTGTLNVVELTKAGSALTLEVYERKNKLGTIVIGRGSFKWVGPNRRNGHAWSCNRFCRPLNRGTYEE